MPKTSEFISALRSMTGTPFHSQGRSPGTSLDCVGLLVCALRFIGLSPEDSLPYRRIPRATDLRESLDRQLISANGINIGTVLLMWTRRPSFPIHVAVVTGGFSHRPMIIEATDRVNLVAEHFATEEEMKRIVKLYRVPGLED